MNTKPTSENPSAGPVGSSDLLACVEWKIEHRKDGVSFVAYPWKRGDKIEYEWMGPYERHVAEWLFDVVKRKQANAKLTDGPTENQKP